MSNTGALFGACIALAASEWIHLNPYITLVIVALSGLTIGAVIKNWLHHG